MFVSYNGAFSSFVVIIFRFRRTVTNVIVIERCLLN